MSTASPTFVTVDGKRFHYVWLRDHCLCPTCHYPESFQKLYDVSQYGPPAAPLAVEQIAGRTAHCVGRRSAAPKRVSHRLAASLRL